jgi:AcrR family transcriptional regulator
MENKTLIPSSRERILLAAKNLFATRGYDNTSTIMIARAAGTSESQLVKHFGSKDGLLEAIFDQGWREVGDPFADCSLIASPHERLKHVFQHMLLGLERDPELMEVMLLESRRVRKSATDVMESHGLFEFMRKLQLLLATIRDGGELLACLNLEATTSALVGACEAMLRDRIMVRRLGQEPAYAVNDILRVLDTMLPALLAPEQARASGRQA